MFFVVFSSYVLGDISLPVIGQDSYYQLQKEKKIGQDFYKKLLRANRIIDDPLVTFYLNEITSILTQNLDDNFQEFKVSVIDDSAINAFAVPGGFIGINYGLILAAQSEAQLAGVLAHEISHIELKHLAQFLKKQESANSTLLASFLLALILSQSLDNEGKSEVVEAVVLGGAAGTQQALINFTRENEYEADRKGLELMKNSGYPGIGMAEFFSILEGEGGNNELSSIEYLRTHPVSANRMGEAYQFRSNVSLNKSEALIEYELFKVYLNSIVGEDFSSSSKNIVVLKYEKALEAASNNEFLASRKILQKLYLNDEGNLWVISGLIKVLLLERDYDEALIVINNALTIYPQKTLLLTQKINSLVLLKEYKKASILATFELSKNDGNQEVRYSLVGIYDALNEENKAREVEGDYLFIEGKLVRAKYLFQHLLKITKDLSHKKILQEKIKKIERLDQLNSKLDN